MANYVLLERIELNDSAASVTFSNIPQTGYTDLKVVCSTRQTGAVATASINFTFNGSSTGFTYRALQGSGSAASSFSGSTGYFGQGDGASATANTFGNAEFYIPNYTGSTNKSISADTVDENNATAAYAQMTAILWSNTAAITSIGLVSGNGSWAQYSTFSLYGLAAVGTTPAIAPKATGGNITTDGTYWIHTFNTSGTFTPAVNLTCDYLVVAGGGGGGSNLGGGGGAGGYRASSSLSVPAASYSITVGAGGAAGAYSTGQGGDGTNSSFYTISATGGGGGGNNIGAGRSGGSGGGAARTGTPVGSGNAGGYSPVEGYAGGLGRNPYPSGGGGGAGGVGAAASAGTGAGLGGAGGVGVSNSISGTATYYAGGGGGCTYAQNGGKALGGNGGGGNGAGYVPYVAPTSGGTNLGGGGGGGTNDVGGNGASGGSGIVIIRYLA